MKKFTRLEKILTITGPKAKAIFAAETAAVLMHDLVSGLLKKEVPILFLLAAFVIPGYLLIAGLTTVFLAAQRRAR